MEKGKHLLFRGARSANAGETSIHWKIFAKSAVITLSSIVSFPEPKDGSDIRASSVPIVLAKKGSR